MLIAAPVTKVLTPLIPITASNMEATVSMQPILGNWQNFDLIWTMLINDLTWFLDHLYALVVPE